MIKWIRVRQVKVNIERNDKEHIIKAITKKIKVVKEDIIDYKIIKKSIDARDKNNIFYVYELDVLCDREDKI